MWAYATIKKFSIKLSLANTGKPDETYLNIQSLIYIYIYLTKQKPMDHFWKGEVKLRKWMDEPSITFMPTWFVNNSKDARVQGFLLVQGAPLAAQYQPVPSRYAMQRLTLGKE